MASDAVIAAVEAELAANWTTTPIVGVNVKGDAPADGSAFVTTEYPVADESQKTFGDPGNNLWKEEGAFRIVLNAPRGQGVHQFSKWMTSLRAIFRGNAFSGVQCFAPSAVAIDNRNDLGNYFQLSFTIPYWTYLTG